MDMQKDMKALNELNKLYGVMQEKAKSAGQELAQKEKDDDAFGAPNKKGKVKRWWDDDGDGKGYEKHEVKKTKKEEVEKRPEKLPEMKALNQLNKLYTEMQSAPVEIDEKESYKTVAAVIDYDRSKKGTDDAVYDTEHGKKKQAKKERDYAAWERSKMKKDDPNWKQKKGSTSEAFLSDWRNDLRELVATEVEDEKEIKEKKGKNKVVIDPELKLEAVAEELGAELVSVEEVEGGAKADPKGWPHTFKRRT